MVEQNNDCQIHDAGTIAVANFNMIPSSDRYMMATDSYGQLWIVYRKSTSQTVAFLATIANLPTNHPGSKGDR